MTMSLFRCRARVKVQMDAGGWGTLETRNMDVEKTIPETGQEEEAFRTVKGQNK